jgi:hypothetical protein
VLGVVIVCRLDLKVHGSNYHLRWYPTAKSSTPNRNGESNMDNVGIINEVSSPKVLRCGCRVIGSPYGERRLSNCAEHKKTTPLMGRAPKKEPKLMKMLHGTIYCSG